MRRPNKKYYELEYDGVFGYDFSHKKYEEDLNKYIDELEKANKKLVNEIYNTYNCPKGKKCPGTNYNCMKCWEVWSMEDE